MVSFSFVFTGFISLFLPVLCCGGFGDLCYGQDMLAKESELSGYFLCFVTEEESRNVVLLPMRLD